MISRFNTRATLVAACFLLADASHAQSPEPALRVDFDAECLTKDCKISPRLDKAVHADRFRCVDTPDRGEAQRALSVTVKPGDAYDPNPGLKPTERAEI